MTAIEQDKSNLKAKKFMMWLFLISSIMLFAGLTSAFIVYSAAPGKGLKVILPQAFMYSSAVILLSSVTMFLANSAGKKLQFQKQQLYTGLTIALGVIFFALQYYGWVVLTREGATFVNYNASHTFIYVFTGFHLLHIFAGLMMLLRCLFGRWKNIPQVRNLHRLEMTSIFWHFIDILWIYLYVFLLLNQ